MKKIGGFKWIFRPKRIHHRNIFLRPPNPFSKIYSFASFLRRGTKGLSDLECIILSKEGVKRVRVPKGPLAVYVGKSKTDMGRVVVHVIYFNHPIFGELLKEAKRVYGLNQSDGIAFPCRVSEFEKVKMRIADCDHSRRKQHHLC